MEDVGARRKLCERSELLREFLRQRAVTVERPVGLVVQLPALEDNEPSVHTFPPQRLHVLPRDPGSVDGRVRDPQLWTIRHRFMTVAAAIWNCRASRTLGIPRCSLDTVAATVTKPSLIELELVEIAQGCSARADAGLVRAQFVV